MNWASSPFSFPNWRELKAHKTPLMPGNKEEAVQDDYPPEIIKDSRGNGAQLAGRKGKKIEKRLIALGWLMRFFIKE
ncbi:hypothetical protein CEXT_554081 [Caerostris extrusa]|uniref:Uncharacterized protein n=1 Tax=Caerostris extrusa TaxID=172846 RepID=A0AAV4P888_CAEEX|nr:hypothetical protein CEXT_554081 [Caerostris extrusa]